MPAITPRGIETDPAAGRTFDGPAMARDLLGAARIAALATLDPGGYPFCTVTNLMLDGQGAPVFFTARLALHARNIAADARVSLTVADMQSDVMITPRLTLSGRAEAVGDTDWPALKAQFQARFPKSKLYLELPDALLIRVRIEAVQLNGGPGQNRSTVTPEDLQRG